MLKSELRIRIPMLWNRNDLLRFRFRLWKSFGFDSGSSSNSGSRQYLAVFSIKKLAFSTLEAALFPRNLASHFWFLTFLFCIPFYIGSGSKSGPESESKCIRFRFRSARKLRFRFHNTIGSASKWKAGSRCTSKWKAGSRCASKWKAESCEGSQRSNEGSPLEAHNIYSRGR